MKITSSNLVMNQNTQKQQTAARAIESSVTVGNASSSGLTASIKQSQLNEALSLISSNSMSLIKDADGNFQLAQSTYAIEAITRLALEEEITVRAVTATGQNNPSNTNAVGITINRVFAFESNTDIQMNTLGRVTTEDGREIDFLLELNYQRDMQVTQTSQFNGNRNLIDPLVINLTGGPAELSDRYFEFDLDGDGHNENLHQTAAGTGFLVFDKNENGMIDDGSEMFGPQTGYGFAELSAYDEDGNGWIDENDSIFAQLAFMDFNESGEQQLQDLSTVGLGAIALKSMAMDFDLYDSQGNFQAQVARSGVALMESGAAVSIQEIYYPGQAFGQGRLERTTQIDNENNGTLAQNTSPLTQFQFNNAIVNGRDEETHVTLELPTYSNRVAFDSYQEVDFSTAPISTNVNSNLNAHTSLQEKENINISLVSYQAMPESMNADEKRASIQNYFQNKIATEFEFLTPSNTTNTNNLKQNTLTDNPIASNKQGPSLFQNESPEDKKLEDLKLLVENLKLIRERQIKMQENLGIYKTVSQLNNTP
ncbi:MAG: hypothetical protein ACJA1U_001135 [Bermanella sp.]|jgi:hypothetical protein